MFCTFLQNVLAKNTETATQVEAADQAEDVAQTEAEVSAEIPDATE